MVQAAAKGITLEFGKSPQLRAFSASTELRPASSQCSLFMVSTGRFGGGKTTALLRACRSIRSIVWQHERSPDWLVLVDEDRRAFSLADQMLHPRDRAVTAERVVFYCYKLPDHWSQAEKSKFQGELESAIDFLSQLAPENSTEDSSSSDADSERHLQLARERRDQLLREERWLDAPAVHIQQGGQPDSQGMNNTASRLRRRGELLGAWNGREYLHPTFQFHPDTGRLMPEMKALLEVLPKDRSGWRQALWLFQRHGQLDNGARPADIFQRNPQSVINAAKSDFELSDERW